MTRKNPYNDEEELIGSGSEIMPNISDGENWEVPGYLLTKKKLEMIALQETRKRENIDGIDWDKIDTHKQDWSSDDSKKEFDGLIESWRKLKRVEAKKHQDTLDRIKSFEDAKYNTELEVEQAQIKKQKRELTLQLEELNKKIIKRKVKKNASREIRKIRQG